MIGIYKMKKFKVDLFQVEVAFSLPDLTSEQLDELHDKVATQYADVATVSKGICNPDLIVLTFSDNQSDEQIYRMADQIEALLP